MYSKGISWINDCRIPFDESGCWKTPQKPRTNLGIKLSKGNEIRNDASPQGRFPANLLVSDDMLNDGSITSQNTGLRKNPGIKTEEWKSGHKNNIPILTQGDKGSNSRYYNIDKWFNNLIDV